MKRTDLIRRLENEGCILLRHGVATTGTRIHEQAYVSPSLDTARSMSIWLIIFLPS